MTVPVLVLNRFAQILSRQRNGMVLCWQPVCTFNDPECGQHTPLGQRCLTI